MCTMRGNKVGTAKAELLKKGRGPTVLLRGSLKVLNNADLYISSWQDTKVVNVLSTFPVEGSSIYRKGAGGVATQYRCSTSIVLYNQSMGGTDSFDQRMSYYCSSIKSRKWTMRVMQHLLMIAVVNSWILYKESHQDPLSLKEYIKAIITQCLAVNPIAVVIPEVVRARRSLAGAAADETRLIGTHMPSMATHHRNRRTCIVCKQITHFECTRCNVGLCIGNDTVPHCWRRFHTENRAELAPEIVVPAEDIQN